MPITKSLTRPLTHRLTRAINDAGAGGGVFDIADFIPQDGTAAYFDLDPANGYVFQDHFGLTPVTAANDPVGLVVPVNAETSGNDLYVGDAPSVGGGWSWSSGTRTGTATETSNTLRLPHANTDQYRYVLDITVTVTGGSLIVYIGAGGASYRATITTSGTYRVHLFSGGAANAGTYFLGSSFTGTVLLNSVKDEHPFTRSQMDAGTRGAYKVDANGCHYIDLTGAKILDNGGLGGSSRRASFAFPAYFGMAIARASAAAQQVIYNSGGTANFTFTNQTSTNAIKIASQKGGTSHSVFTRSGSFPLNLPVPADLYITAGQTSSYVSGGVRDIPDDVGLAAGELRTVSNDFVGTEVTNTLNVIMRDCHWYGGFIRMGSAVTASERNGAADWLKTLIGQDALDAQEYDIFAIAGQSNAMGVGSSTTATAVPFGEGVEYIDSGYIRPFKEPMQHGMPGQVALNGSAWGAFCARWYAQTGRRACIVGSAWSGEGLINGSIVDGTWLEGEALTDKLALKLSSALTDVTGTFRGVIYIGGENDSSVSFTQAEYQTHLANFLTKLRTKTGISDLRLMLCSLDDTTGSPAAYATMRAAMAAEAAANDGIDLIVPFQDYVIGQGLSSDGIHLNQTALNDMGLRAADGAKTALGL